jgi:hypothetical protein
MQVVEDDQCSAHMYTHSLLIKINKVDGGFACYPLTTIPYRIRGNPTKPDLFDSPWNNTLLFVSRTLRQ